MGPQALDESALPAAQAQVQAHGGSLLLLLEEHLPGVCASRSCLGPTSSTLSFCYALTSGVTSVKVVCDFVDSSTYEMPTPLLRLYEALDMGDDTVTQRLLSFDEVVETMSPHADAKAQFVAQHHEDPTVHDACVGFHLCGTPALLSSLAGAGATKYHARLGTLLSLWLPHLGLSPMPPALFAALLRADLQE